MKDYEKLNSKDADDLIMEFGNRGESPTTRTVVVDCDGTELIHTYPSLEWIYMATHLYELRQEEIKPKEVVVKSNSDLLAISKGFDNRTIVKLYGDVVVYGNIKNAEYVVDDGSCGVVLAGRCHATVLGCGRVVMRERSTAVFLDHSVAERIEDDARAILLDYSHANVHGGSVDMRDNSHANVFGGRVSMFCDSTARCYYALAVVERLFHNSTLVCCCGVKPWVAKKHDTATVVFKEKFRHTKGSLFDMVEPDHNGDLFFYKQVDYNNFGINEDTKYVGVVSRLDCEIEGGDAIRLFVLRESIPLDCRVVTCRVRASDVVGYSNGRKEVLCSRCVVVDDEVKSND